jgi:hypothetical protein
MQGGACHDAALAFPLTCEATTHHGHRVGQIAQVTFFLFLLINLPDTDMANVANDSSSHNYKQYVREIQV